MLSEDTEKLARFTHPAKASRPVLLVVLIAAAIHCAFYYVPLLRDIPSGISISICAILAALLGAFLFPVKDEEKEVAEDE